MALRNLLGVLVGLLSSYARVLGAAGQLRGRRGIWFVDNVAALMALVKGRSDVEELEKMAELIHAMMFALSLSLYFEWVASKSNWADGISRDGSGDEWLRRHGFEFRKSKAVPELLALPFRAMVKVAQCL